MRNLWIGGGLAVAAAIAVVAYLVLGPSSQEFAPAADTSATTESQAAPATDSQSASAPAASSASSSTATTAPATGEQMADIPDGPVAQIDITADDRILGSADAPVTVVEYASMTCPHCARFSAETLPKVKSEFIDTGKVRWVFRDFPLDKVALSASLLAHYVPGDAYFNLLDVLFRSQNDWARASDPTVALSQIGRTAGLEESAIDACMNDQALTDRIVEGLKQASDKLQVNSTPTFFINGVMFKGALPFDDYEDAGVKQPGFASLIRDKLPAP